MDNNQDNIEKYLDGLMGPEEVESFEEKLDRDASLRQSYEEELTARNLIATAGRLGLKNTFERFESEIQSPKDSKTGETTVIPLWMKRVIPIAAMIVVFIGAYWFMTGSGQTTSKVFDTYFEVYDAPTTLRDTGSETPLHWNTAVRYYNEEKYDEALRNFTKSEEEIPEYLIDFYSGICAMSKESPDYNLAVAYFLKVENGDNDYRQQASWYRGLALLGNGEKDKAMAIFHDIVEKETYAYRDAQKIIRKKLED